MSNINENSLIAYEEVKPHLSKMQMEVYRLIEKYQYITAKEISDTLKKPINSITPRLNELMYDKQMIKISGQAMYKRPMAIYSIRHEDEPVNVRKLTAEEKLVRFKTWLKFQGMYIDKNEAIDKLNKILNS